MIIKRFISLLLFIFVASPAYSQVFYILNQQDGKALDLPSTSTMDGQQIQQWTLNGTVNQQWKLVNLNNGYFEIVNCQSGQVLDLPSTSTANGTIIQQWDWEGTANQQWAIVDLGNGYFKIQNQQSGKVLDLPSTQTADGVLIQQWDWSGTANQQWQLKPAGAPVQVSDLTNPSYAPSLLAGDSYKYEIYGAPNQPVKYIQNGGPLTQVGQTDAHGYFALTGSVVGQQYGNYTQTWFVGSTQIEPTFAFSVIPTVVPYDVTNPNLTPNFAVGDTYQYTVLGPPNQPVYEINNGNAGTRYYQGQTDATGRLVVTEVGIKNWIGSYTQVWSVGSLTASPALSFAVGQFGSVGTVTTTNIGQTSDGHLEGVSMLSITNGLVSTYSATNLDSTASLYYDSDTVATLFANGAQIKQAAAPVNINTVTNLSANATAWDDYDLQSDHYAVAYFLSGGYYENPLYWGNSCYAETGDVP